MEMIEHPPILHIPAIPDHILYTWLVMAILVVVSFVATRRVALVPTGSQNFMEMVLDQFVKELDETIGHEGRGYLPLIATLGLFILTSNLMGLIPGLVAPTANLNTTAACALIGLISVSLDGVLVAVAVLASRAARRPLSLRESPTSGAFTTLS